ncbi:MAG: (4Fe-4S)-binding protein [Clostridiales Family XIII bacterium]|jgi:Fe-S-cluster-containing dehydrogenase component|nr:(4Fe-4S)-binding protein [Clostridiales Family XIII bacterium]
MKKWHIVFDADKCIGCYSCLLSCKDEHVGNCWLPYADRQQKKDQKWIGMERKERGAYPRMDLAYRPTLCNHCGNAPCVKNAPDAFKKREDGIVILDPAHAQGAPELVKACPYGRVSWNEEIGAAQKCTLCAHLIDEGWQEPRCVQACPLKALRAVKLEDPQFEKLVADKGLRALIPESSRPRVYYKNLHRFDKHFIAGEIAYLENDEDVCAKNADIRLVKDGAECARTKTNPYGDFRFDALESASGEYTVEAELPGRGNVSVTVRVEDACVDIGTVYVT